MSGPPADLRRDTPLARVLKDEIFHNGPVDVATYMSRCLWDDQHGYYATKAVFGREGDFITAAEISQTFGEIIGLWAAVVWQQVLDAPARVTLAEYGPGRGTMMYDALRAARVVPGFAAAAHVHLVEMSEALTATQRATLARCGAEVTWGRNLVGFPVPAIIVANEFLDAWPVVQWVKTANGWQQRGVGLDSRGDLAFVALETAPVRGDLDPMFPDAPPGSIVESQKPERMADALKALAAKGPVAAIIIDYGYAALSEGDTLQAVRDHGYESPLASPGEADLSAHVNFFELATALHGAGLAIDGPVTQAEFLGALGIVERAGRLMTANPARAGEIETGVARLIAPNGMGTRFKVIGIRSPELPPLPGFEVRE